MEDSGVVVSTGIKRRYKVIGLLIVLLVGIFVVPVVFRNSALEKRYAAIRADGFPVTLSELNDWYSIPVGAENAADTYIAAFEAYYSPDFRDDLPILGNFEDPKPGEKLSAETIKLMEEYLADNEETLELLREASKIKDCRYPLDFTLGINVLLEYLGENKKCAMMLSLKSMLDVERGRGDLVVEDIEVAVAVARSREKEPVLISQLVRIACLALTVQSVEYAVGRVDLNDEQLKQMMRQFADAEAGEAMLRAMAGERCVSIDFLLNPSSYPGLVGYPQFVLGFYSASGLNKSGLLECLDFYEDNISAMRLPEHERSAALRLLDSKMDELPWFHAIVSELRVPVRRISELDLRCGAHLRLGRVGLAVERYRLAEGKLPETLDVLVPRYIDSVPLDPFDGKPLRYKLLEKGYVVYSVGEDGVDNGGIKRTKENRETGYDFIFKVEKNSDKQ